MIQLPVANCFSLFAPFKNFIMFILHYLPSVITGERSMEQHKDMEFCNKNLVQIETEVEVNK